METILLIESDPASLVALALVLRSLGYEVLEAGSRGEAWSVCCGHQEPIRIVMTEVALDGDGLSEFVTRLQLVCPQIRALVFCDADPSKLAYKRHVPCEHAFLQRPFRVEAFAEIIRTLLYGAKMKSASSLS